MRVDVPHLRSIEQSTANDFDELVASIITGKDKSYIINGFEFNMTGAINSSASSLQVIVANSAFLHGASSESGTFFLVPSTEPNQTLSATTNPKVSGTFTPSAINYIGLEFTRAVDDSTLSQVYLWNLITKTEFPKTSPLGIILDYKFVITSTQYASNILPIAIVETDGSNNVLRVEDRRPMLFRLGTAGTSTPNPTYEYPYNNHIEGRVESQYSSSSNSINPFHGGDKQFKNQKEWMDAVMSAIKEIKGTSYWYEANSGGSLVKTRGDISNLTMTGKGNISHSDSVAGKLNWSEDIYFNFVGSRLSYKINANPSSNHVILGDDQGVYFTFVRDVTITPNLIYVNGSPIVISVGAVSWTNDVLPGDFIKPSSQNDSKYYKILSVDSSSQVTLSSNYLETSTGGGGEKSVYAWGIYETSSSPSTPRHLRVASRKDIPFTEDTYWLFLREDNGGSVARVYVRGSGFGELEQGESRDISDNINAELLEYIGSPSEAIATPSYEGSITPALAEIFTVTLPPASSITSGQSFTAYSSTNQSKHGFWFNKDSLGGNPLLPDTIMHEVAIDGVDSDTTVASKLHAIVDATTQFNSVDNLDGTITVTLSQVGSATDPANVDVGGVFSITVDQQGSGSLNNYIIEGENLTKSIKRLDTKLHEIITSVTEEGYEEALAVVVGAPVDDNEIQGPVLPNTEIIIPLNSRNGNLQQGFKVNAATLAVYLNGVRQLVNVDYNEVGLPDETSIKIENLFQLEINDVLTFKIEGKGIGGAGGGGATYSGANLGTPSDANVFKQLAGTEFQFRRLSAGSNITIVEGPSDITINSSAGVGLSSAVIVTTSQPISASNDIVLADTSSTNITLTLPDASTNNGKIFYIKKISASNNLLIKSVMSQTLDGVDIDTTPHQISINYESTTIAAVGGNWYFL